MRTRSGIIAEKNKCRGAACSAPAILLPAGVLLPGFGATAFASAQDAGTNNPFTLGAGGRALGLGRAYAAVADDASALFWNPAGLSQLQQIEVSAMHIQFYFDTPYDFVGAAYPVLDWGTFAVGAVRVASGEIVMRDDRGRQIPGEGSLDLREYLFGYGRELVYNIRAGVNFKIEQERLLGDYSTGVGLDAGLLYTLPRLLTLEPGGGSVPSGAATPWDQFSLGVNFQNAVPPRLQLRNEADIFPLEIKAGAAYRWESRDRWKQSFLVTLGAEKSTWRALTPVVGAEYGFYNLIALRAGWCDAGWTTGAGLQMQGFLLDYALAGEELGLTHRFSLAYRFGTPIADQRQAQERQRQQQMDKEAERRAGQAVEKARKAMDQAMKNMERKHRREKETLRSSLQAAADKKLAAERQRQSQEQTAAVANEYFKAMHYFQGVKDYLAGNFRQAMVEFETVAKYDPKYLELPIYLGKARQRLKGGVQMSPQDLELYYRGIDLYVEEKFADAIGVWQQILERDPDNMLAQRNIQEARDRIAKIQAMDKVMGKEAPAPTDGQEPER